MRESPAFSKYAQRTHDRPLGTMVTYGYPEIEFATDYSLAILIGASVLEILPNWGRLLDAGGARRQANDRGLVIHSVHGCWGGRTIRAGRVDLGSVDASTFRESVDDLKACIDWLASAGGTCLVVHPGGLSDPAERAERRDALSRGLQKLADHADGTDVVVCVENMPPGVYPGSSMAELAELLSELDRSNLAARVDTGHANLTVTPADETRAAGSLLATTHVHDNNGRQDSHEPPGLGTIDWSDWGLALDSVGYAGPILLECIRHLRQRPESWKPEVVTGLLRVSRTTHDGS